MGIGREILTTHKRPAGRSSFWVPNTILQGFIQAYLHSLCYLTSMSSITACLTRDIMYNPFFECSFCDGKIEWSAKLRVSNLSSTSSLIGVAHCLWSRNVTLDHFIISSLTQTVFIPPLKATLLKCVERYINRIPTEMRLDMPPL